tara:strand:+ start:229 stop:2040 length:1812 start_codon:yes stop_codon:yes gene_type:complete
MAIAVIDKRSATQLTAATGAQPLTVQADRASLLAPFESQKQMGAVVEHYGSQWLAHEFKLQHAGEMAAASAAFDRTIAESSIAAQKYLEVEEPNATPDRMEQYFRQQVGVAQSLISSGAVQGINFTRPATRRAFNAAAAGKIATQSVELRKWQRKRIASRTIANKENEIKDLEFAAARASTPQARKEALTGIANNARFLEGLTHWSAEQRSDAINKSYSTVDRLRAELRLADAAVYENEDGVADPKRAMEFYESLTKKREDGDYNYKHLTVEDRAALQEQSLRMIDSLVRRGNQDERRRAAAAEKELAKRQRKNTSTFRGRIIKSLIPEDERGMLDELLTDEELQHTAPTLLELNDALATDDIDLKQYDKLIAALSDDNIVIDHNWFAGQLRELRILVRDGMSQPEMEDWLDATQEEGYPEKIDWHMWQSLENYWKGLLPQSTTRKQITIFGDLLDALGGAKSMLDRIGGVNVTERKGIITAQFQSAVAEGIKPLDAFHTAMSDYLIGSKLVLSAPESYLPRLPADSGLRVEGKIKALDTWIAEDVDLATTEMLEEFSGRPSSLALAHYKLAVIREYIRQKPTPEELAKIKELEEEAMELQER